MPFLYFLAKPGMRFGSIPEVLIQLKEMENDRLLKIEKKGISVPSTGRPFVRNICMAFDLRLQRKNLKHGFSVLLYSKNRKTVITVTR